MHFRIAWLWLLLVLPLSVAARAQPDPADPPDDDPPTAPAADEPDTDATGAAEPADDTIPVPDWIVKPLAQPGENYRYLMARAMEPLADFSAPAEAGAIARARTRVTDDLIGQLDELFEAMARVFIRRSGEDPMSTDDDQDPASREIRDAIVAELQAMAREQVAVLETWQAIHPLRENEALVFALAGIDRQMVADRFRELADERMPDRVPAPMSPAFAMKATWAVLSGRMHEDWAEAVPEWIFDQPAQQTEVLQTIDIEEPLDQAGMVEQMIAMVRFYSDGPGYEYPAQARQAFVRVTFHTNAEPWKQTNRLQTQLTGGFRMPLVDRLAGYFTISGTIASDVGPATFDGAEVGLKFDPIGLGSRLETMIAGDSGGEEATGRGSTMAALFGADFRPLSIDAFAGFPRGADRNLLLNDVTVTFGMRVSLAAQFLRFEVGGGAGRNSFFRLALQISPPLLPIPTSSPEIGLILISPGIDMEWRLGDRNLDRYHALLMIQTKLFWIDVRTRLSGELGHTFSATFGLRLRF